jgi:hypothetical protein
VLSNCLLSEEELCQCADAYIELDSMPMFDANLIFGHDPLAPLTPPEYQQQALLDKVAELGMVVPNMYPFWVPQMCQNRDRFEKTAICVYPPDVDTYYPQQIYLPMLMCKNPLAVHFLVATLRPTIQATLVFPVGVQPAAELFYHLYDEQNFLTHNQLPFDAEICEIGVLTGVTFWRDAIVCPHRPVSYERFIAGHPKKKSARVSDPSNPRRPKAPASVVARLLAEYPWLTSDDINGSVAASRAKSGGDGGGNSGSHYDRKFDDDECDDLVEDVLEELAAKRAKHADDDADYTLCFYVRPLGGNWTKKHCLVLDNAAGMYARSWSKAWCKLYSWPNAKAFYYSAYGEESAFMLARAWAQRGAFFMTFYLDSDDAWEGYTDDMLGNYIESSEFELWAAKVPAGTATFDRIAELRAALPVYVPG